MRLLLVEDDPMIGESVALGLKACGYAVDWARDGQAGESLLQAAPYALLLLDIGLPGKDGLALLRAVRARKLALPVLLMTARDTVADRVGGLDAGADDYLVKPFDLDELAARVRALLRRAVGRSQPLIEHGALAIDPSTHAVTLSGRTVPVSAREFALLLALAERPAAVLSRAQLEQRLYNWDHTVGSNAVEVHIHNLRRKLGEQTIRTVRGVGYTLGAA